MTNQEKSGGKLNQDNQPPRKPRQTKETKPPANEPFPIVGVGASAGGLEAFKEFFTAMPPDSGMAFVIVQHLDPTHESILTDLLKKFTRMPVMQVTDPTPVQPNWVYVIPPNTDLTLRDGALYLARPAMPRGMRLPIDHFFRSLATDQGEKAICVILSGTGTDGTLGLKAIKEEGGLAIAQAPDTTRYDGMPISAINTGLVDMVLAPDKMAAQLIDYVQRYFWGKRQQVRRVMPGTSGDLQKIFILLKGHTGHDFSGYKENTITRRIERRMAVNQITRIEDYLQFLQQTPPEIETLFRELLIGVTSFFRDPRAFESLVQKALLPLFSEPQENPKQIRVWVPGCSTGEEAYSVAILLHEQLERSHQPVEIQVFATDIDQGAIAKAREGRYPDNIAADVSPERLMRFFGREKDGDFYQVKRQIRDMVVFAEQSVIKDPPFSRMDLICCRNLMIYLGPDLQRRLLSMFHYALNPGGYLFLGNSEALGNAHKLFQTLDKKWKIFKRAEFVADFNMVLEFSGKVAPKARVSGALSEKPVSLRQLTEQLLLTDHVPTSVLVSENGEMLYVHGNTGKFLEQRTGEVSTNIMRIAREGLRLPLSMAVRNANTQKKLQTVEGISVKSEAGNIRVKLTVSPVFKPASMQGLLLLTFAEMPALEPPGTEEKRDSTDYSQSRHISELEQELNSTREYLQTVIEELETTNEELKSSNEEMQSTNEELQSTNEELQTSKEELQSVNEELITVNTELQIRVDELTTANDDIKNLMESTQISIIFLDTDLRIRRFTEASGQMVDFIPQDVGRPLKQFAHKLRHQGLIQNAQEVLDTQISKDIEVQAEDGCWHLLRMMPYRTVDDQIAGVVLTLTDVSHIKEAEEALQESQERLALARSAAKMGIWDWNLVDNKLIWDERMVEMTGLRADEFSGAYEAWQNGLHPDDRVAVTAEVQRVIRDREEYHTEYRILRPSGETRYIESHALVIYNEADQPWRMVGVNIDITERKQAEEKLRHSEALYASLVNSLPQNLYRVDLEGRVTFANQSLLKNLGVSEADILGKTAYDFYPPDLAEKYRRDDHEIIASGKPLRFEEENIDRATGNRIFVDVLKIPILDNEGRVVGIQGVFEDITQRKQAEEALYKAQGRLQRAESVAHFGNWELDLTEQKMYGSEGAKAIYELSGPSWSLAAVQELPLPEYRPLLNAALVNLIEHNQPYNIEFRIRRPSDGGLRDIHSMAEYDPDRHAVFGVIHDITDRKQAEEALQQSEEKFRGVYEQSPIAIQLYDKAGKLVDVNQKTLDIYGLADKKYILGYDMWSSPSLSAAQANALKNGNPIFVSAHLDFDQVRETNLFPTDKSGSIYVEIYAIPLMRGQEITGYLAHMLDITERKQTEEALLQARKLESVGVLAGGIAHDFNNLMTTLSGNIELAKLVLPPTHPAHRHLEKAGYAREKAVSLTRQLLTFAKGGAPIKEVQDIGQLLAEAATFAMHGSKSKLNLNISPDLWLAAVDAGQISQVINNLIINARQAMPKRGSIALSAVNVDAGGQPCVEITIQDEGKGIDPENLDKIFDPYFSTKPKNSGLGLATVHSIVTKHNGQISVTSRLQQGTTFTIRLPASPQAEALSSPDSHQEAAAVQGNSVRVLVLDDDEAVRVLIEGALATMGHQVTVTAEGQATVTAYQAALDQENPYQAVILDLTIPGGMAGQEVAQKILDIDPQARLIVSSGYAIDPVMANFEDHGFKARLQKPYSLKVLQQTLQEILA